MNTQTPTIRPGDERFRAMRFGTRKMPEPIIVPTTMVTESSSDKRRGSSSSDMPYMIFSTQGIPMTVRWVFALGTAVLLLGTLCAFQQPFREYPGVEYRVGEIPLPPDWREKTEFVFARLMYPPAPGGRYGRGYGFRGYRGSGDWREGDSIWTQDYPRADRHFLQAVRRLTRIQVRSVEQPVNLDNGSVYDWPWLYAVQTGHWQLTDAQAKSMREYLLRGGFFMADDFWGDYEWDVFMASMKKVFPDREVVELDNKRSHLSHGL